MARTAGRLRDDSNVAIMNAIRNSMSPAYQARIPQAVQGNIQDTVAALFKHRSHMNEFIDELINRIGTVYVRNIAWNNPLSEFKTYGMLEYGDTIQEIQVGLLQAHVREPAKDLGSETLFTTELPEVKSAYHTVNRQVRYDVTIDDNLLRRAFVDPTGLNSLVSQLLESPTTSDQWDEFLTMINLLNVVHEEGGFYHVNVPDAANITSGPDESRAVLRAMRAMAMNLTFLSSWYNPARMPTFIAPEDIVIFMTPEMQAALDVEALAAAFNISYTDAPGRIITVPKDEIQIPGFQAMITSKNFFVMADQSRETTNMYNPATRRTKYFLHVDQVVSASLFVPTIVFWTGPTDDRSIAVKVPTGIGAVAIADIMGNVVTDEVERGSNYQLSAEVTGGNTFDYPRWEISGNESPATRVSNQGVLSVGSDEVSTEITVTAHPVYRDPADPCQPNFKSSVTLNVTGEIWPQWPITDCTIPPAP